MDIRRHSFQKTEPIRMTLEEQLYDILEAVMSQYDNHCFFVGKKYLNEVTNISEYMGYNVIYSPLIEAEDETIYFAPANSFYINTNN